MPLLSGPGRHLRWSQPCSHRQPALPCASQQSCCCLRAPREVTMHPNSGPSIVGFLPVSDPGFSLGHSLSDLPLLTATPSLPVPCPHFLLCPLSAARGDRHWGAQSLVGVAGRRAQSPVGSELWAPEDFLVLGKRVGSNVREASSTFSVVRSRGSCRGRVDDGGTEFRGAGGP